MTQKSLINTKDFTAPTCPLCSAKTKILTSKKFSENVRRRYYACSQCNHRFSSMESFDRSLNLQVISSSSPVGSNGV
ncbi:ogr/Delta-like zinc finger family protein [Providencia rettgeri]|uniref:ogr/Delta-like zinc finger family protein n=1 Tax=Providencia rettgeri TaxID=587 RepID=UPI003AFAC754